MTAIPTNAEIVVIGGGIVGCSTAYHLAKLGRKDVVLLERNKLTSGSTWHAAGLVGQLRTSANITQLLKYSVELYGALEAETGQATGWKMNGGLRLACNAERLTEIRRQATTAHSFGLDMHLLSASEARDLWPAMDVSDVVGAAFLPTDGQVNPSDLALALAKGARQRGVKIIEDCPVTAITTERGRVTGVVTAHGTITADIVVNCCGQWARQIGALAGVNVPLVSVQHQYLITEPIAGVPRSLPTLRDPDRLIYFKEEVGGLVMGGYEPDPIAWAERGVPDNFAFQLLDDNWEHFEPLLEQAIARVPALQSAGIKQLINGPESFTPDGNWMIGEAPEVRNFYVGAGFNAFGIASAGGAGRALAEWIAGGEPPMDLWPVDIRRFGAPHRSTGWVRARTMEAYAKHYTLAFPSEEYQSARPARVSPLYEQLKVAGACFGEKLGWERANWFAPTGVEAKDIYTYGRQNWFPHVGAEHQACREAAALFDQSSFAKFLLAGPGAARALDRICANHVTRAPGTLTYTQMLNGRGGIECDLTVARLADNEFTIVTGTGFATHDFDWIRRNIPADCDAALTDVTSAYAVLTLMGPLARAVLEPLCETALHGGGGSGSGAVNGGDAGREGVLGNAALPFMRWKNVTIAGAPVRAQRVTYVGELGWELHVPVEFAAGLFQAIVAAGQPHGLRLAGYRAIESLRLEKGYRAWGSDIGPDHTPLEAGLGWAVKFKSGIDFIGRPALEAQRATPLKKRLACFVVDDPGTILLGRETIFRDGKQVGWLTSGGWGYTVNANIGYGYVRDAGGVTDAMLASGQYELEVATERVGCRVHMAALYDPGNLRVKA
ncbi:MAG: GcvT family protein [Betaproteobacteria bacterium]|nr:GcvT family protein [Betaproteobacteria bacterium]